MGWFDRFVTRNSMPGVNNDCGAGDGQRFPNMDSVYGVGFNDACTHHDVCYATKGATQRQCDLGLRQEIYQAFEDQCPEGVRGVLCRMNGRGISDTYYQTLSMFGHIAFQNSQRSRGYLPPAIDVWDVLYEKWTDAP